MSEGRRPQKEVWEAQRTATRKLLEAEPQPSVGTHRVFAAICELIPCYSRTEDHISRPHLAVVARVSESTVTRAWRWLQGHGVLEIRQGYSLPGKGRSASLIRFPTGVSTDTGTGSKAVTRVAEGRPVSDQPTDRCQNGSEPVSEPCRTPEGFPKGNPNKVGGGRPKAPPARTTARVADFPTPTDDDEAPDPDRVRQEFGRFRETLAGTKEPKR